IWSITVDIRLPVGLQSFVQCRNGKSELAFLLLALSCSNIVTIDPVTALTSASNASLETTSSSVVASMAKTTTAATSTALTFSILSRRNHLVQICMPYDVGT